MSAPGMGAPPGGGRESPCIAEFSQLRADVEKAGKSAKAVTDHKGTREEFCKAITNLHAAQVKWVKYTAENSKHCGIPSEIIGQLKLGQTNLAKMRNNVCNGGAVAGVPATPSLSEALGTSRLPVTEEAPKKRGGTLETLTGEAIR
jgi:hypothetical protein